MQVTFETGVLLSCCIIYTILLCIKTLLPCKIMSQPIDSTKYRTSIYYEYVWFFLAYYFHYHDPKNNTRCNDVKIGTASSSKTPETNRKKTNLLNLAFLLSFPEWLRYRRHYSSKRSGDLWMRGVKHSTFYRVDESLTYPRKSHANME